MQTVNLYTRRKTKMFNWQGYYRLSDIYAWLDDLSIIYPEELKVYSIGLTQGRQAIAGVTIILEGSRRKSSVMIEGGIHAREWISPAFVTYFINRLLHAGEDEDVNFRNVAFNYEWHLVPLLNPDGYEYSHDKDRLWRKNYRGTYNLRGVDLNRNFDMEFGTSGVSNKTDKDNYPGVKAFSEMETIAMARYVHAHISNMEYYITIHSFGQYLFMPTTKTHKWNYEEVKKKAIRAVAAIKERFNTTFTTGNTFETLGYSISGTSCLWVKNTYNVPYVITFELRDKGRQGFALAPQLILPTCQETLDGLVAFLTPEEEHKSLNERNSGGDIIKCMKRCGWSYSLIIVFLPQLTVFFAI